MLIFYAFKWRYEKEKANGICSPTFAVDAFSELFLHPSIFSIKHSRSA